MQGVEPLILTVFKGQLYVWFLSPNRRVPAKIKQVISHPVNLKNIPWIFTFLRCKGDYEKETDGAHFQHSWYYWLADSQSRGIIFIVQNKHKNTTSN